MLAIRRAGDRIEHRLPVLGGSALDFREHDQPVKMLFLNGECRYARRADCGMTLFDAALDILRIQLPAAQDDEVLDPPGDVELTLVHEPEIAGAQRGRPGAVAPVAAGDGGTCHAAL